MPALDSLRYDPTRDGATKLQTPMVNIGRREPHQITAGGPVPIAMATKPRPMTTRVSHQLAAGRTNVMHRDSNVNPDNAGGAAVTSSWGLSGPEADGQDVTLIDQPEGSGVGIGIVAAVGVGLGALAYFLSRR